MKTLTILTTIEKAINKNFPNVSCRIDDNERLRIFDDGVSSMPDGFSPADYWNEDYEEKMYTMSVHNDLIKLIDEQSAKLGLSDAYFECENPESWVLVID